MDFKKKKHTHRLWSELCVKPEGLEFLKHWIGTVSVCSLLKDGATVVVLLLQTASKSGKPQPNWFFFVVFFNYSSYIFCSLIHSKRKERTMPPASLFLAKKAINAGCLIPDSQLDFHQITVGNFSRQYALTFFFIFIFSLPFYFFFFSAFFFIRAFQTVSDESPAKVSVTTSIQIKSIQ